jgi:hypothetical protein
MPDVDTLHREAMELVDQEVLARQQGDAEAVIALSKAAFTKERTAADLVADSLISNRLAPSYIEVPLPWPSSVMNCERPNVSLAEPSQEIRLTILPMNSAICC